MARRWDDLGHVAGFRTWLSCGRYVRRGEHGFRVLAPCRYKVTDAGTGDESWALRGFTVDTVFAGRQTDGECDIPEPIRPTLLAGDGPEGAWDALAAEVRHHGFCIERRGLYPVKGETIFPTVFVPGQVIVADRLDDAAAVKTLWHELGHVLLHQPGQMTTRPTATGVSAKRRAWPTWCARS